MNAFSSILFQITVMFLLIMSGVFLYRIHWISEETNKQLSKIVISFVNPALMFCAYTIEFKESLLIGLLEAFGICYSSQFQDFFFEKKMKDMDWNGTAAFIRTVPLSGFR